MAEPVLVDGVPVVRTVVAVVQGGRIAGQLLEGRGAAIALCAQAVETGVVVLRCTGARLRRAGRVPGCRGGVRRTLRAAVAEDARETTLAEAREVPGERTAVVAKRREAPGLELLVGADDSQDEHQDRDGPEADEGQYTHLPVDGDPDHDADHGASPEDHCGLEVGLEGGAEGSGQQNAEQSREQCNQRIAFPGASCVTHHEPLSGIHAIRP